MTDQNRIKELTLEIDLLGRVGKGLIGLELPERDFPRNFYFSGEDFVCAGYYVGYDEAFPVEKIPSYFKKGDLVGLANSSNDFLIIYKNLNGQILKVLTGQSGRFPAYFSIQDNKLFLSTSFGWVMNKSVTKNLNWDSVFDYLYTNYVGLLTEQTIIKEIFQVPPATLLTVDSNGDFELKPLIEVEEFLELSEKKYLDKDKYLDDFIELLTEVIKERLRVIGDLSLVTELTSGFDITLVAAILADIYPRPLTAMSRTSTLSPGDNVIEVTKEFAKKHGIKVIFNDFDRIYPFVSKEGLDILKCDILAGQGADYLLETGRFVEQQGFRVIIEGHGGDELYGYGKSKEWFRFPIQSEYFWFVSGLNYGLDCLYTEKGVEQLLDKKRFCERNLFPSILSTSAIEVGRSGFPYYWRSNSWGVAPLIDPRIAKLAIRAPEVSSKQEMWRNRMDIFVESQFIPKKHYAAHVSQFLVDSKTREFAVEVLKKSKMGSMSLIRAGEIVRDLESYRIEKYSGELLVLLCNIISLEYFIQENKLS